MLPYLSDMKHLLRKRWVMNFYPNDYSETLYHTMLNYDTGDYVQKAEQLTSINYGLLHSASKANHSKKSKELEGLTFNLQRICSLTLNNKGRNIHTATPPTLYPPFFF